MDNLLLRLEALKLKRGWSERELWETMGVSYRTFKKMVEGEPMTTYMQNRIEELLISEHRAYERAQELVGGLDLPLAEYNSQIKKYMREYECTHNECTSLRCKWRNSVCAYMRTFFRFY